VIPRRLFYLRNLALWAAMLLAAAAAAAGCQAFAWLLVKTVGPWVPEDTVHAEYDLNGKSLLVLVDTKDPAAASEFPRLESALADAISKVLAEHKACGPIVPAHSVDAARQAEPKFNQWSVAQVGKFFNVDLVLHVEVLEFRLRDAPGSNVYQGYTEAAVRLVSPNTGQQVWPVLSAARLMTGETQPDVTAEEPGQQESILTEGYAEKVARLFFTHKVADLPMRPKVK